MRVTFDKIFSWRFDFSHVCTKGVKTKRHIIDEEGHDMYGAQMPIFDTDRCLIDQDEY